MRGQCLEQHFLVLCRQRRVLDGNFIVFRRGVLRYSDIQSFNTSLNRFSEKRIQDFDD